jgi:hypothetical protein
MAEIAIFVTLFIFCIFGSIEYSYLRRRCATWKPFVMEQLRKSSQLDDVQLNAMADDLLEDGIFVKKIRDRFKLMCDQGNKMEFALIVNEVNKQDV